MTTTAPPATLPPTVVALETGGHFAIARGVHSPDRFAELATDAFENHQGASGLDPVELIGRVRVEQWFSCADCADAHDLAWYAFPAGGEHLVSPAPEEDYDGDEVVFDDGKHHVVDSFTATVVDFPR